MFSFFRIEPAVTDCKVQSYINKKDRLLLEFTCEGGCNKYDVTAIPTTKNHFKIESVFLNYNRVHITGELWVVDDTIFGFWTEDEIKFCFVLKL